MTLRAKQRAAQYGTSVVYYETVPRKDKCHMRIRGCPQTTPSPPAHFAVVETLKEYIGT